MRGFGQPGVGGRTSPSHFVRVVRTFAMRRKCAGAEASRSICSSVGSRLGGIVQHRLHGWLTGHECRMCRIKAIAASRHIRYDQRIDECVMAEAGHCAYTGCAVRLTSPRAVSRYPRQIGNLHLYDHKSIVSCDPKYILHAGLHRAHLPV